jgi:hypothetical protein
MFALYFDGGCEKCFIKLFWYSMQTQLVGGWTNLSAGMFARTHFVSHPGD